MSAAEVLIIRPNDMKTVYGETVSLAACEPPFWAAVIAAALREKGISAEIIDAEAINDSPETTAGRIKDFGESLRLIIITVTGNNLSASTWKMHGAGILASAIKAASDVPILLWGLHPSSLPERTLKEENIDFVMKGEGLSSLAQLAANIADKAKWAEIKGLYYKDGAEIKGNPLIDLAEPKDFPAPAWELLPMERYKAHNWQRFGDGESQGNYAVIAASLGCPFHCNFCAVSTLFGQRRVRFLPPEKVVAVIDELVRVYGVHYIKIIDECFVLNKKFVNEVCDLLIERRYDLNIWAYARVDTVDEDILGKLYQAGIRWLCYGIESANELSMQEAAKGQYGYDDIVRVVAMTKKAGINVLGNFMFGLPEDDLPSMEKTLALAREINPEWINMYCTVAYPGSELYSDCAKNGVRLPDNWLAYAALSYEAEPLATKHLSSAEVLQFRDRAFDAFFADNPAYFSLIEEKFGAETAAGIRKMLRHRLKRKLLGD